VTTSDVFCTARAAREDGRFPQFPEHEPSTPSARCPRRGQRNAGDSSSFHAVMGRHVARYQGRMSARPYVLHAVRLLLCITALGIATRPSTQVLAAAALYFALFTVMHDLMHGAYGLPRRTNELLLTLVGFAQLGSGHAMRRMHLHHHARPLADTDVEGAGARRSLWGALAIGPQTFAMLRIAGYRQAPARERRVQTIENVVSIALIAGALAQSSVPALRAWAITTIVLQVLAPLWASHVPHNTPVWLAQMAQRLSFIRSPVLLSLAYHDLHHRHPKVPCHRLGDLATV
jgi:fatty acid desaturase